MSEEVLDQLREAILAGRFKPGDKLPSERELTQDFGVSRVVVREAIRALELTGFVTLRQGPTGGAFVTDLSLDHLVSAYVDLFLANKLSASELAQARRHIEPETARLAALRVDAASARRLEKAFAAEQIQTLNHAEWVSRNMTVHYLLAGMCGNRFYEAIVNPLLRLTEEIIRVVKPVKTIIHSHEEHGRIVAAVAAGNAPAAAAAMADHVARATEALVELEKAYRHRAQTGSGRAE